MGRLKLILSDTVIENNGYSRLDATDDVMIAAASRDDLDK